MKWMMIILTIIAAFPVTSIGGQPILRGFPRAGGPFKPGFGLSGQLRVPHSIPFRNRVPTTCENPATNGTLNMLAAESRSHPRSAFGPDAVLFHSQKLISCDEQP